MNAFYESEVEQRYEMRYDITYNVNFLSRKRVRNLSRSTIGLLNIEKDTYRQESTSWLFDIPADLCLLLPSGGWCFLKAEN